MNPGLTRSQIDQIRVDAMRAQEAKHADRQAFADAVWQEMLIRICACLQAKS